MRILRKIVAAVVLLYIAFSAGMLYVMRRPIMFGEVMRRLPDPVMMVVPFKRLWFIARAGRLKVGDRAPTFSLLTPDKQSTVSLAAFRGQRPVLLIFGSYT